MKTVLLVEDNLDNQTVIEDIFEFDDIGAELVMVGSAEEAIERIEGLAPVLVLMDLGLPGMSGLEATAHLKASPLTCDVPVWALTAHAMKEVMEQALAAGCAEYVTKPIDAVTLSRRLAAFVSSVDAGERRVKPIVLIVDDHEDNRCVMMDALETEGYVLREAADGIDALEQIERETPDLVLLDVMMPRMDGIECCRRIAGAPATEHIPVLLVTALDADEHVVRGLDAGARDFVGKPFSGPVVRARVRAALRAKLMHDKLVIQKAEIERLAGELETKNAELEALALHDGLTGLPNRLLFMDRLDRALARVRRLPDQKIALLYLDFDRFKQLNDTLGHAAGDIFLKSIAERLRAELRTVDTVAGFSSVPSRLGGDEFVILLEELRDASDVEAIVKRILDALAKPHAISGREVVCTASIGVVTGDAESEAGAMLRDADAAMYYAKQAGRSRHAVFDASMRQDSSRRAALENQLRDALAESALTLHYQPMIRLDDGSSAGVEALIRWPHPERGLLVFEEFADVALSSGLITDLDAFVVAESCRQMARWRERLGAAAPPRVTVNLSMAQLDDPTFPATVGRALADAGVQPGDLMFDIPERIFAGDSETAHRTIAELHALGVPLALDNWGAGSSGLAILRDLPVQLVKIDRALIGELDRHVDQSAVVHSVIDLAHNLRMLVAAVGIENDGQLAQLQAMECDIGQGLHLGRPTAAEAYDGVSIHAVTTGARPGGESW